MDFHALPQPFTLAHAMAAGLTPHDVRGLIRAGVVRRVVDGVYVDDRYPDSLHLRSAALSLALPAGAIVCRTTAAWLHGVDVLFWGRHRRIPPVEFVVRAGSVVPGRTGLKAYEADLQPHDIDVRAGVEVTTALRTTIDLARWLTRDEAVASVDAMAHAGLVDLDEAVEELARWKGERNTVRAAEVFSLADPGAESPGESLTRLRIIDARFPRPQSQVEFFESGILIYRLDLALLEFRAGVEYDGAQHERQRAYDEARRAWFERRDWRILSVGMREALRRDFVLERAVGELLGLEPWRRRPIPGWG